MWKQKVYATDEYSIALSKELSVCANAIKRIRKTLSLMEQKHHKKTEVFIEELTHGKLNGNMSEFQDDYQTWQNSFDSLKKWEELEKQYREALNAMKK